MSFGDSSGAGAGGMADKEVQEFVMMEEQKAQFMMQKKERKKAEHTLEVVVGTYEALSLGYRLSSECKLEQTFTDHSHAGCVKAAAISTNGVLATGSSDEMIRLFNVRKHKELGVLVHHEGTITWLEFHANTHMFSCSSDGTIGLWNTRTWECLKTFRGHKGAVNCCACHPTGKLALSVGEDKTLRLWNLVTGRSAYTTNLKIAGDYVKWSTDGERYMIVQNHTIQVCKTEGASLVKEISCSSRIHALHCDNGGRLYVGVEEGKVVVFDANSGELIYEENVHEKRVKAMVMLEVEDARTLVTASSDGLIRVWEVKDKSMTKLTELNTKFRITSMGAWYRRHTENTRGDDKKEKVEKVANKSDEPKEKKAKVSVEFETDEAESQSSTSLANDKLAQRLLAANEGTTKMKKGGKRKS